MIIFLYGADTFRSRKKLNELKDKFIREVNPDGSGIVLVDGEKATLEKINEAVAPASLFSRRRFIIVEDVFKKKSDRIWDKLGENLGKLKEEKESKKKVFRFPGRFQIRARI